MHQADNDWPALLLNIRRKRQVWGLLGKLLRRDGADPIILEKFYRVVVQAVILFGSETWVLTAALIKNLEGVHVGFLQEVTDKMALRIWDNKWKKEGEYSVIQEAGTRHLRKYINKSQEKVAELVDLRPIFEVCVKDMGYEEGGRFLERWWRQAAVEKYLKSTLKYILVEVTGIRQAWWGRWRRGRVGVWK